MAAFTKLLIGALFGLGGALAAMSGGKKDAGAGGTVDRGYTIKGCELEVQDRDRALAYALAVGQAQGEVQFMALLLDGCDLARPLSASFRKEASFIYELLRRALGGRVSVSALSLEQANLQLAGIRELFTKQAVSTAGWTQSVVGVPKPAPGVPVDVPPAPPVPILQPASALCKLSTNYTGEMTIKTHQGKWLTFTPGRGVFYMPKEVWPKRELVIEAYYNGIDKGQDISAAVSVIREHPFNKIREVFQKPLEVYVFHEDSAWPATLEAQIKAGAQGFHQGKSPPILFLPFEDKLCGGAT